MFLPDRWNARPYNLAATRQLHVCRAHHPTSILSVDKFKLCLCLVFRPPEILLLFFFFSFAVHEHKKLSGGDRSGYNLFYSRLARNSAVDGWTPIYPHLSVINVNGLVGVDICVWPPVLRPHTTPRSLWPLPVFLQQYAALKTNSLANKLGKIHLNPIKLVIFNHNPNGLQYKTRESYDYACGSQGARRLIPEGIIIVLHSCTSIKTKGKGKGPPRCRPTDQTKVWQLAFPWDKNLQTNWSAILGSIQEGDFFSSSIKRKK